MDEGFMRHHASHEIMSQDRNMAAVPEGEQQLGLHGARCLDQYYGSGRRIERFHYRIIFEARPSRGTEMHRTPLHSPQTKNREFR